VGKVFLADGILKLVERKSVEFLKYILQQINLGYYSRWLLALYKLTLSNALYQACLLNGVNTY
jgi:hypothetical protein